MNTDIYRDPQALVLAPINALKIGRPIVAGGSDDYKRTINAVKEALVIIEENESLLGLKDDERSYLNQLMKFFNEPPDEDGLIRDSLDKYNNKIADFGAANYGF
ncbi:MAG: methyltransferase MtaB domain-containing protein [Conexivisphaerales archaeon]